MALYGGKLGCVAALREKARDSSLAGIPPRTFEYVYVTVSCLVDFLFSPHFLILASHAMYMGRDQSASYYFLFVLLYCRFTPRY